VSAADGLWRLFGRESDAARDRDPKQEAMRLWNADPCGSDVAAAREDAVAFFRAVDADRYGTYAPWLPAAAEFDRHADENVLEIGCGMGTDLASFFRGGARVFAIDLTLGHLQLARRRLQLERSPVRILRADAEQLPFASGSIDTVYSFGVLHHTPGTAQAIAEIHRVLRPGGRAIVALYHRHSVFYWFYTLFVRGILHGRLFADGYRRLIADVERHEHTDALPLVKVYSRGDMRRLFAGFGSTTLEVHHLKQEDFAYAAPVVRRLPQRWIDVAAGLWGWYIFAKATK
jgi:SAM-dependent methyltransferase